jgi:hypothetical protein
MADKDISFNISLDSSEAVRNTENFNKSLKNTENQNKSTSDSFKLLKSAISGFIAVISIQKITQFVDTTIKAYTESEKMNAVLKQTMITTGKYSDSFLKSADALASSYQKITVFNDEAIKSGQKWLLLNKDINEKTLPQATKAMLDYASFSGKGVEESGKVINKALSGNARAFKELGINIKESELQTMSSGEIISLVMSKVGGSAEAMGKTTSGRLAIMANSWDEAKERMGEFFSDIVKESGVVESLNKIISALIDKFEDLNKSGMGKEVGESFKGTIDSIANSLIILIKHLDTFVNIIKEISEYILIYFGAKIIQSIVYFGINIKETFQLYNMALTGAASDTEEFTIIATGAMSKFISFFKYEIELSKITLSEFFAELPLMVLTAVAGIKIGFEYIPKLIDLVFGKYTFERIGQYFTAGIEVIITLITTMVKGSFLEIKLFIFNVINFINQEAIGLVSTVNSMLPKSFQLSSLQNIEVPRLQTEKIENDLNKLNENFKKSMREIGSSASGTTMTETNDMLKETVREQENLLDKLKKRNEVKKEGNKINQESNDKLDDTNKKLKEMTSQLDLSTLKFKGFRQELEGPSVSWEEYGRGLEEVYNKINQLSMDDLSNSKYIINQKINDYRKLGIDETTLEKLRNLEMNKLYNDNLNDKKVEIESQKDLYKELTDSITSDFTSAFEKMLETGKFSWNDLGDSLKSTLAKSIAELVQEQFFKPMINYVMAQLQQITNASKANIQSTQAQAQANGYTAGGVIGGAGFGYGVGQMMGTSGTGGAIGGAAGSFFGPIGSVVGSFVGSWVEGVANQLSREKPKIPSIDILWEVIDGQVSVVANEWKNANYSQEVIDNIKESMQKQVDFSKKVAILAGQSLLGFTGSFQTSNLQNIQYGGQVLSGIQNMVINMGAYVKVFGTKFTEDLSKKFDAIWSEYMSKFRGGEAQAIRDFPLSTFPKEIFDQLTKILDPAERLKVLNDWLNSKQWLTRQGGDLEVWWNPKDFVSQADQDAILSFMDDLSEKLQKIKDFYMPSISQALLDSLSKVNWKLAINTDDFKSFTTSLKNNLAATIRSAVIEGFIANQILPTVFASFAEKSINGVITRPSLTNLLSQYQAGETPLSEVVKIMNEMGSDFTASLDTLNPLFVILASALESINMSLGDVSGSLTGNTIATESNTDAIVGPVNDFLKQLTFGQLAPSMSTAQVMEEQAKLFSAASANSELFSQYADFMTSTALPYLQTTAMNYADLIESIKSQATGLPWYMQAGGEQYKPHVEVNTTVQYILDGKVINEQVFKSLKNNSNVIQQIKSMVA